MGYEDYSELKQELIVHLAKEKEDFTHSEIGHSDKFDEILAKVIDSSIQALTDIEKFIAQENGEKAVEILSSASRVQFYGLREAANATQGARDKFARIGVKAQAFIDPDEQLISASLLSKENAAFGISHSGRSKTTVAAMEAAQKAGAYTLWITNSPGSQ